MTRPADGKCRKETGCGAHPADVRLQRRNAVHGLQSAQKRRLRKAHARANSAEDDGNAAVSDEKLSALVYEAVVKALRDTGRSGAENIRTPTEEVREEKEPQQKTEKKETAVTRLAEYDLPEDVINSALAFADRFG